MWWLLAFTGVALAVYAFIDVLRSESIERAGLARVVWLPLVILLPFVGPIGWLIVSYMQRAEDQRATRERRAVQTKPSSPWGSPRSGQRPTRRSNRPSAPDDDPEFLAELGRTLRQDSEGDAPEDPKTP